MTDFFWVFCSFFLYSMIVISVVAANRRIIRFCGMSGIDWGLFCIVHKQKRIFACLEFSYDAVVVLVAEM